jgi:phosphatidate cytidylyltransferase
MPAVDAGSARDSEASWGLGSARPRRPPVSGLVSRLLVSAALLPLVIGVVYLGGWWLFALALGGGLIALHELYAMAKELRPLVLAGYVGFVLALLGVELGGLEWLVGGILLTFFLVFVLYGLSDIRTSATATFGVTMLGVLWVAGGLGLPLLVRDIPEHGFWAVIAILFTVFAADTVAFFVGRAIGRHKMAPAISPGKTWEGFVAGIVAAMAASFLILYKDRDEFLTIPETLLFGAAVALAGVFGDLFESALKRDLGFKDSGRLLGAHGGMLDRLDALLWAGPAAYFVILAVS